MYPSYKNIKIPKSHYPKTKDIFKALQLTPFENIKVVILGQDPYHDGNATGVAFACKKSVSPSLKQIWNSIKKDSIKELENVNPNLEHLVQQGVLLVNTILTVEEGIPLSHKRLNWEHFIEYVLNELNNNRKNIVYMLWGSQAKAYSKYINSENNLILTETHPVYAAYNNKEWNCTHFSQCNKYLKEHNIEPIKWR